MLTPENPGVCREYARRPGNTRAGLSDVAGVTQPASPNNAQGATLVLDAGFTAE
jgi:hypothetical protein